jgi:hypothetical protein
VPSPFPDTAGATPVPSPVPDTVPAPEQETVAAPKSKNVTDKVQLLGNPFNKQTYARNVWDMQFFNGAIYLGHGNSSDYQSATNAGPIDIIKYDIVSNSFINEYTVNENQIDVFNIINGRLVVPGHETRDTTGYGSFYTLDGQWTKSSTIPLALNVYDMTEYNGKLYAVNRSKGPGPVLYSEDGGRTWETVTTTDGTTFVASGKAAYSLFKFKGDLYAASTMTNARASSSNNILKISVSAVTAIKFNGTEMFPGLPSYMTLKLKRVNIISDNMLFISGKSMNQHQYEPTALYISNVIGKSRKITFEESKALPNDILIRGTSVYVLASIKISDNESNYSSF